MNVRTGLGLGLLALGALSLYLLPDEHGAAADAPGTGSAAQLSGSPSSCLPCHAAVVAEWQASMHSQAFTDPQVRAPGQADNFRKPECLPCHAPGPVFVYGIEADTRVVERTERRQDGVDCRSCHGLAGPGVAAARSGLSGACQPTYRAQLESQALCAPCHNQHATHDEWRASPAATAGDSCNDCHMPRITRSGDEAGAPRAGRSHRFLGGRDMEFALPGMTLTHEVDRANGLLHVTVTNAFAGHNLPTVSRNRSLDVVVTLFDARGAELPAIEGLGDRYPGGEAGTARLRFRNPYRSSGNATTQIPAGERRTLSVPVAPTAVRATIALVYKLEPWIPDDAAAWTHRVDVTLD